ncbi:MAG: hypothetical protein KDD36_04140 [Flavobacteriales bacterium]|nr:hypothetical protein [Flavobacteriales bacterium]
MKRSMISILHILFFLKGFCQQSDSLKINLDVVFNNRPVTLNDSVYHIQNGHGIKLETLKFYLSGIQLLQNGKVVYSEKNSYHLVDVSRDGSRKHLLQTTDQFTFDQVRFNLGIDSTTNVSGAMGGDLDPTKGMYWTWQSGYVNFKMEGTSGASDKRFEFHLGGYQHPFSSLQIITLDVPAKRDVNLMLDLGQFFKEVDLSGQKNIMSPCAEGVTLSQQLAHCFGVK